MSGAPLSPPVPPDDLAADAGPQRLSPWFGLIGLLLLATLLAVAFVQARQYTLLNLRVQYQDVYLVLSPQQLETESLRLRERLRKRRRSALSATLQLRYDIFVSRVSLLGSDRAPRLIDHGSGPAAVMRQIDGFIRRADLYLGSEPRGPLSPPGGTRPAGRPAGGSPLPAGPTGRPVARCPHRGRGRQRRQE